MKIKITISLILFFISITFSQKVYQIENEGLIRVIQFDRYVSTIKLVNKYTGEYYPVDSEEFKIMIDDYKADFTGIVLTNKDFELRDKIKEIVKNKKLVFPLINKKYGIEADLYYEADGKHFSHKWIEIKTTQKRNISTIDVERINIIGAKKSHPMHVYDGCEKSDGPVYADNFFMGLEFPKHDNTFEGNYIRLKHFPGKDLHPGESYLSKKAVIGAVPNKPLQRHKDMFFQYIDEYRGSPVRNFKVYNTWFLLVFNQNEKDLLNGINTHVKPLYDRGIKLDGYVVDDGWQNKNTLWEVDSSMIPSGLGPKGKIQTELKKYDCNLHLWLPLTGQYGLASRGKEGNWYEENAYETGSNWCLCLAPGNKIYKDKKERLLELVKDGVKSFKADFAYLGCDKKGHNHLPNKYYGMEANVEGVIDIISSLKQVEPKLIYYLTTSINRSPWWLKTNDILWESAGDDIKNYSGNGEPTPAQVRMSGRDDWHWRNNLKWFVPQTSYMTHGIIASSNPDDELYTSLQELIDISILYYARGVMWSEIYVTDMNDRYWDTLAEVIKWSDKNYDILTKQPVMSGGPSEGKPYYWSHFNKSKGLVIARNPGNYPRVIEIPVSEESGIPEEKNKNYKASIIPVSTLSNIKSEELGVFSYNQKISVVLEPWQVKVIEINSVNKPVSKKTELSINDLDLGTIKTGAIIKQQIRIIGETGKLNINKKFNSSWLNVTEEDKTLFLTINSTDLKFSAAYNELVQITTEAGNKLSVSVKFNTDLNPDAAFYYLSELKPEKAVQDYGTLANDKSCDGHQISIAGQKFERGLGSHANSEIIYNLEKYSAKKFQAYAGHDDETKGSIQFFIYTDNGEGFDKEPVFRTPVMKNGDKPVFVDIDITKTKRIKLVITDGGNNINGDHGDWADAKITR